MERIIERLQPLNQALSAIQRILDFDGWERHSQFAYRYGLGRVALIGSLLGMIWGIHASILIGILLERCGVLSVNWLLDDPIRLQMYGQWSFYLCAMATFHLLEFFITAIFNPSVTSSESYLVNQSKAYTAAFLIAFCEFWIRFICFPATWTRPCILGSLVVALAQIIRSWAMITCGESFNHLIQTSKKDNHVLITHGVYKYFRHPSYVGFFYWSIGTQLVLNNWCTMIVFTGASMMFFRRRIPYEEESLIHHFPNEYAEYAKSTWVGIPFIPNIIPQVAEEVAQRSNEETKED